MPLRVRLNVPWLDVPAGEYDATALDGDTVVLDNKHRVPLGLFSEALARVRPPLSDAERDTELIGDLVTALEDATIRAGEAPRIGALLVRARTRLG